MATIIKRRPRVIFISREQVFRFSISGLLPLTIHNMYFERDKVDPFSIKPLSGSLGDQLKSDENGKLVFDFYFQTGLPAAETTVEQAQEMASTHSRKKQVIVASISDQVFPTTVESILSIYSTTIDIQVAIPPLDQFNEVELLPESTSISTIENQGGDTGGGF
jgi:hypothetical protein